MFHQRPVEVPLPGPYVAFGWFESMRSTCRLLIPPCVTRSMDRWPPLYAPANPKVLEPVLETVCDLRIVPLLVNVPATMTLSAETASIRMTPLLTVRLLNVVALLAVRFCEP